MTSPQPSSRPNLFPILVFLLSQAIIWMLLHGAEWWSSTSPSLLVAQPQSVPTLLQPSVRWDGAYYVDIADSGYCLDPSSRSSVAFFPLYPALTAAVKKTGLSTTASAVVLSSLSTLGAFLIFYRLALLELKQVVVAQRALLYLAFFPTAYYLSVVYTESLFLLLSVGGFYAARRGHWGWAAFCGLLATATRPTGMILWGGLALEWMNQKGFRLEKIFSTANWKALANGIRANPAEVAAIASMPLGLVSYMRYLGVSYGDPWVFAGAQAAWGRSLRNPLWEVTNGLTYGVRQLFTGGAYDPAIPANSVSWLVGMIATVAAFRWLGQSYGMFCLVSMLVPSSAGIMSLSRFLLVIFPIPMVMARATPNARWQVLILTVFILLLALFSTRHVSWHFFA